MKSMRDAKRRPTHPGETLREDVLPALGMTQGELAKRLGVSRLSVSELLHGKRALSADMALRIARLTSTTAESWLRMQAAVDLWELERDPKRYPHIEPVAAELFPPRCGRAPGPANRPRCASGSSPTCPARATPKPSAASSARATRIKPCP